MFNRLFAHVARNAVKAVAKPLVPLLDDPFGNTDFLSNEFAVSAPRVAEPTSIVNFQTMDFEPVNDFNRSQGYQV